LARIMLCDDSVFMRMILKKILVGAGHEIVGEAGNGVEAVRKYREFKPDLATMDITMPEMDGIEAVKLIRKEFPEAKIVMVTAIGQQAIVNDAIKAGAGDFIVKPFQEDKVLTAVIKQLSR